MLSNGIGLIPADDGGCGFYRIMQPGEEYARLTNSVVAHLPAGATCTVPNMVASVRKANAKFILIQRQFSDVQVNFWKAIKRVMPEVPIYMDWDDLLFNPHPSSDYNPTPQMLRNLDVIAGLADRLICSTKPLQEVLWQKYKKKAIILPNMIDDGVFRNPFRRNATEKLRVLWAGSKTHQIDLEQIIPVVQETHKRYEWHFMGYAPPELSGMVRYHEGVKYSEYLNTLATFKAHVGIAPLSGIPFNRCKSNVKLLEYGALGMATIANSIYPYNPSPAVKIATGTKTEWLNALGAMEDEKARQENARLSQDYSRSFSLGSNSDLILKAYN